LSNIGNCFLPISGAFSVRIVRGVRKQTLRQGGHEARASFPALETERLEIRAVTFGDGSFYHELLSISAATRFSDFPDAPSRAQSDRILHWMSKRFSGGKGCAWIIADREGVSPSERSGSTVSTGRGAGARSATSRTRIFGVAA